MAGRFDGQVAIVTAGGSGIGAASARRFADEGAVVVVADLSGTRADAVASSIGQGGGRAVSLKMDASDPDAVERTVRLALGMKYCLPVMRARGKGVIVNTASISGTGGDYGLSSYNAAKAGVINLTRSAAIENARHNIRINCVCPGFIDTRAAQILGAERADEVRRIHAAAHPIGRVGQPGEIASTVLFLASEEASFITGAAIVADGGVTAHTGLPHFPRPAR
jgi:meso-butanediol dehydrogenase / (S,S)-butanediol dehydrogenase / diacetyl reductase